MRKQKHKSWLQRKHEDTLRNHRAERLACVVQAVFTALFLGLLATGFYLVGVGLFASF